MKKKLFWKMAAPSGRVFEIATKEEVAILKRLGWTEVKG